MQYEEKGHTRSGERRLSDGHVDGGQKCMARNSGRYSCSLLSSLSSTADLLLISASFSLKRDG